MFELRVWSIKQLHYELSRISVTGKACYKVECLIYECICIGKHVYNTFPDLMKYGFQSDKYEATMTVLLLEVEAVKRLVWYVEFVYTNLL